MTTPSQNSADEKGRPRFFYGWIMLGVAFTGMFVSGPGQSFTISVFKPPILKEFGISDTSISSAYGLGTLTAAFGLSYVGILIDRYGVRRVMASVAFLLGASAMLFSTIGNLFGLYVGFTAIRIFGQGSMMLVSNNLASQWFVRRRGLAMSIVGLGFAVGTAAFPPAIQWLIGHQGWRATWVWLGGFTWVLMIPLALLLVRNRPGDMGLLPDGAEPRAGKESQPVTDEADDAALEAESWTVAMALRTRQFWIMAVAMSIPSMLITGMVFHQISYFEEIGLGAQTAANVFTYSGFSMVASGLFFGYLFDRFPTRYVVALGQLVMTAAMLAMWIASTPLLASAYGLVFGVAQGAMITMGGYVWPAYFGRKYLGAVQGAAMTAVIVGASLGPLPFGIAFDLLGSYGEALLALAALPIVAAVVVALTPPPVKKG